jgi:hypothetical protein
MHSPPTTCAARNGNAVEPMCLATLADVMARVTASSAARTATARAMAAVNTSS